MQTCHSPLQIVLVIIAVLIAFALVGGSNVFLLRQRRQERAREALRREQTRIRMGRVITTLEAVRDQGPTGPDPLPPCRFCGQGPGHWTKPANEKCPSVIAWRALQNFNRNENELIQAVVRV